MHLFAGDGLRYVLPAAIVIIVLWIAWRLFRRSRRPTSPLQPDLKIDVAALPDCGPPQGVPMLELYNLPVRLAAIVLAPVGAGKELPPFDQLPSLLEGILPGLDKIADLHRPLTRRWPIQVSPRGFAHLFFVNVHLPGDAGKGSPWSSVAGVAKVDGQPLMAGLLLCADKPNSLGQTMIETEHQWLGCLRVRWN